MAEFTKASVYSFWFGLIQTIVLVGGVGAGVLSLASARRARRSASLLRVLTELENDQFTANTRIVIGAFPAKEGTLGDRVRALVLVELTEEQVQSARVVVEHLSDMVHQMELNLFRERELFRTAHPRIIDVAYRLEPFVMVVSAQRGQSWGLRVRRLLVGAIRYYQRSPAYKEDMFLDPHGEVGSDGRVNVWFNPITPRWEREVQALLYSTNLRSRLTPTRRSMHRIYRREREAVATQLRELETIGNGVQSYDIF
ncbi:MAG: hypothetical protein ABIO06_06300 [Pseudolysinimonas sp.]